VGDRRRFRWARWSLQGATELYIAHVEPDEHPTRCWAPVQGGRCSFGAKLAKSKQLKMSNPTASMSSFAGGLSSVFQRPTCESSLAVKESIPPLESALQRLLHSRGMWHFLDMPKRKAPYLPPRILSIV